MNKENRVSNIKIPTSKFNRNSTRLTTLRTGELTPVYVEEILPGDIMNMDVNMVARTITPITAVMDNAYIDLAFYFVPNRIIWEHWEEFMGANKKDEWVNTTVYTIPQITIPVGGFSEGTLADHLEVPIYEGNGISINHLPFRAYVKIFNDWYRNQNTVKQALNTFDNAPNMGVRYADAAAYNNADFIQDAIKGGRLAKANKIRDYFTEMLPAPQKGAQVALAIVGNAPITTGPTYIPDFKTMPMTLENSYELLTDKKILPKYIEGNTNLQGGKIDKTATYGDLSELDKIQGLYPNNLYADLSQAGEIELNLFRKKLAEQQVLELKARAGTRYVEILQGAYGITATAARLDRAEYLGGMNTTMTQGQVAQTSSTDQTSPQGNIAAFSLTADQKQNMINKAFDEHGWVIGLAVVRTAQTYSQGLHPKFTRKVYEDIYQPLYSNLGEQAALKSEIYFSADQTENNKVFGYKEYGAEYRYKNNTITGLFRHNAKPGSIDFKHYGIWFDTAPTLNNKFTEETDKNMLRTLAAAQAGGAEIEMNLYFQEVMTRRMPIRAIPAGLERLI